MSDLAGSLDPESSSAIDSIDNILSCGGLRHGTRRAKNVPGDEGRETSRHVPPSDTITSGGPELVRVPAFARAEALVHAFSTRIGGVSGCYRPHLPHGCGDLNLGFTDQDDPENVRENRRLLLSGLQAENFSRFAVLRQRHTPVIRILQNAEEASLDFLQPGTLYGDGVVTNVPGVLLTVQTADCVPVLLFDPVRRAVAAFHAGWRGTLARIVERGAGTMRLLYGSEPADILAAIGPSIGPQSYAVGEEVQHEFGSQFSYAEELFREVYNSDPVREKYPMLFLTARAPGHSPIGPQVHLDLWEANRRQLLDAGLANANIIVTAEDTSACTERFFSHRAEQGFTGRMMAAIGLTA